MLWSTDLPINCVTGEHSCISSRNTTYTSTYYTLNLSCLPQNHRRTINSTTIMATNTTLTATLRLLITANHILHHHSLVDAFGHISARNPLDPSTFYMASMLAPAVVTSPADLVQYHVSNGSAVDADAPQGYRERFIHSEILRQFPSVGSVVHSHADEVLPYTIVEGLGVEPAFHMAGFLGASLSPPFIMSKK